MGGPLIGNILVDDTTLKTNNNDNIILDPGGTGDVRFNDLTGNRVPYLDADSDLEASSVTDTELGYLSGVSSGLQSQLDAKLDDITSSTDNALVRTDGTSGDALQDSGIIIDDNDNLLGAGFLELTHETTPSNPSSGSLRFYTKNDDKLYTLNSAGDETEIGSGSGLGGISYFEDFEAETIGNVSTYDDVSAATDLTGGTPSVVATASETTNPLSGETSYKLDKPISSADHEGWSITSGTIDRSESVGNAPITISFTYETSANYVSGDVDMYVYDVGNTELHALNGRSSFDGDSENSLPACPDICTFSAKYTPNSSTTTLRLGFHVTAGSTASAWDIIVDRVKFAVNDTAIVQTDTIFTARVASDGTVSNESLDFIDGNCTAAGSGSYDCDWIGGFFNESPNCVVAVESGASAFAVEGVSADTTDITYGTFSDTTGSNAAVIITCQKVDGDQGNVVDAVAADYKNLEVEASNNGDTELTANTTDIDWTEVKDTHNAWDGSGLTAPYDMKVVFSGSVYVDTNTSLRIEAYIDGTQVRSVGGLSQSLRAHFFSGEIELDAGEELTFRSTASEGLTNGSTVLHWISITGIPRIRTFAAIGDFVHRPVSSCANCRVEAIWFTCVSSPSIQQEFGDWVSSITRNGLGNCTLNIRSGIFSSNPICTCNPDNVNRSCQVRSDQTWGTGALRFEVRETQTGGAVDSVIHVQCMGEK